MSDPRENILARLVVICEAIDTIRYVKRNAPEVPEASYPAIVIWDGDEQAADNDPTSRPQNAPRIMTLTPEIYILLSDKAADVGTSLNVLRAAFIKAILADTTLRGYCLDNMGVRYEGMATGLSRGRSMIGEAGMSFSFRYVLRPDDL